MERILEPELMDDPAQALAYGEADFASSDQAFADRILALLASSGLEPGRILDLGCGPGNISFRLAAALPDVPLLALDGSAPMLDLAERRRQAAPEHWPRLHFLQARLPLPDGALEALPAAVAPPYTLVVSNSLLHHLHDPAVLWDAVRRLAAPGAAVYLQDLRRPPTPEAADAFTAAEMASAPEVLRRDYRHSLQAAFTKAEVAEQLERADLEGLQVQEVGPKYLEVWGRLA